MGSFSRRTFLKTTASLAAATAVSSSARGEANDRIGIGIIGCRNQGVVVSNQLHATEQFDILALCDCDTAMSAQAVDRLEGKLHSECREVQDFRELLDDPRIDAVVVATPDHWHALMTCLALDAGKHVLVEKPASYNIGDGKAMVAMAKKYPELAVQVGTMQRSGQHFIDAYEFIREGNLGKIGFARAVTIHDRGPLAVIPDSDPPESMDYDLWVGPVPYRPFNEHRCHYEWHWIYEYGTGEMGNWGAHWVDIARWYLGHTYPEIVSAQGFNYRDDIREWPDTQTVLYQYPDCTLVWEMRMWTPYGAGGGLGNGCEFSGENGSLRISRGGWTFLPRGEEPVEHGGSDMGTPHMRNFAEAIRGKEEPNSNIEDGHVCANLCHLGNIASLVNRPLKFDSEAETIVGDAEAQAYEWREYRDPWKLPI